MKPNFSAKTVWLEQKLLGKKLRPRVSMPTSEQFVALVTCLSPLPDFYATNVRYDVALLRV